MFPGVDPCRDQRREQRQASLGDPPRRGGGHDRRSDLGAESGPPRPRASKFVDLPRARVPRNAKWLVRYGGGRWSVAEDFGVSRLRRRSSTTTGSSRTRSTRLATRAGVCCRRPSARRPRRGRGCRWPTISGRLVAVRGNRSRAVPSGETHSKSELSLFRSHPISSQPARKTAGSLRPTGSAPGRLCRHYRPYTGDCLSLLSSPATRRPVFRSQESPVDP